MLWGSIIVSLRSLDGCVSKLLVPFDFVENFDIEAPAASELLLEENSSVSIFRFKANRSPCKSLHLLIVVSLSESSSDETLPDNSDNAYVTYVNEMKELKHIELFTYLALAMNLHLSHQSREYLENLKRCQQIQYHLC